MALIALLYPLNLAFYTGSRIGNSASWRLEHGRVWIRWGVVTRESFYVAINRGGWLFRPEFSGGRAAGDVLIPLWLPMSLGAGLSTYGWVRLRGARRAAGCCTRCSYDMRDLPRGAVCPECGSPAPGA